MIDSVVHMKVHTSKNIPIGQHWAVLVEIAAQETSTPLMVSDQHSAVTSRTISCNQDAHIVANKIVLTYFLNVPSLDYYCI